MSTPSTSGSDTTVLREYSCGVCSSQFTSNNHLKRHLLSHESTRKHTCCCGKGFTRKDLLTRHQRSCGQPRVRLISRRKSCHACIKTKSKCDLGQPCFKCNSLEKDCSYATVLNGDSTYDNLLADLLTNPPELCVTLPSPFLTAGPEFALFNKLPPSVINALPFELLKQRFDAFFSVFLPQFPTIHAHSWNFKSKPSYLLLMMQACGALVSGTISQHELDALLTLARSAIFEVILAVDLEQISIFSLEEPRVIEQVYLLQAIDMLQAFRMFDRRLSVRKRCNADHDYLMRCVQSSSLFSAITSWRPTGFSGLYNNSIEQAWISWAQYESAKRAMWISQLQDFSQITFFGRSSSYFEEDRSFSLPSEDALWDAPTSERWYSILMEQSPFGSMTERMMGVPWETTFSRLCDSSAEALPLNAAAHYIIIHYIQSRLGPCVSRPTSKNHANNHSKPSYVTSDELLSIQQMLTGWLRSWRASPGTLHENALRYKCMSFYWATQLSLLAHYDSSLPISLGPWTVEETTFLVMMHWMKYIRLFLEASGNFDNPCAEVLWNGLLQIQVTVCTARSPDAVEISEGFLAFVRA